MLRILVSRSLPLVNTSTRVTRLVSTSSKHLQGNRDYLSDFDFTRPQQHRNQQSPSSGYRQQRFDDNRASTIRNDNYSESFGRQQRPERSLEEYEKTCSLLKTFNKDAVDKPIIAADRLAYLPLDAFQIKTSQRFIDETLPAWWAMLEENLKKKQMPSMMICKGTMTGLKKLNEDTNGGILLALGAEPILTLVDYIGQNVGDVSTRNFSIFQHNLVDLIRSADEKLKQDVREKLESIFVTFLKVTVAGASPLARFAHQDISSVALRMSVLDIRKPSEETLKDLCTAFGIVFGARHLYDQQQFQYFMHFEKIALVLLKWEVDGSKYGDQMFWSKWFDISMRCFVYLEKIRNDSFFMATYLEYMLLITLKFDQEKSFLKYKEVWVRSMDVFKFRLRAENLMKLNELATKKYVGHPDVLDEISTKEIMNALRV